MMTDPSEPKEEEDICPMCKRPKDSHSNEEMLVCSKKMMEFEKNKTGDAGIE